MRIAGPRIKLYRVVIMRMVLPLLAFSLSTTALAAPTLKIELDRREMNVAVESAVPYDIVDEAK